MTRSGLSWLILITAGVVAHQLRPARTSSSDQHLPFLSKHIQVHRLERSSTNAPHLDCIYVFLFFEQPTYACQCSQNIISREEP
jgi:hypothetical protein